MDDQKHTDISNKINYLVELIKLSTSNKEKAEFVTELKSLLKSESGMDKLREYRDKIKKLGFSQSFFDINVMLFGQKSEYIWHLLDVEHLSLETVRKLVLEAKINKKSSDDSFDSILKSVYEKALKTKKLQKSKFGYLLKNHVKTKELPKYSWNKIDSVISQVVSYELKKDFKHLDPIEYEWLINSLKSDLRSLINQYKIRANNVIKNGIPAENKILRQKFIAALDEIGITRPDRGQAINKDYAEFLHKKHRKISAESHPDKHPNNNHMIEKFKRINEAYVVVLQYLESQGL